MKTYTAVEAIKLAKIKPDLIFIDKEGNQYRTLSNWYPKSQAAFIISQYEPFTAHKLVPVDSDKMSKACAERLIKEIEGKYLVQDGYGGIAIHQVAGEILNIIDTLTEQEGN